jgi:hypothetical protein
MLAPFWFSPRGGAITRGGIDYKYALSKIWLVNNFRWDSSCVSPVGALLTYRGLPKVLVDDLPSARNVVEEGPEGGRHYVFRSAACHRFPDLKAHRGYIYEQLLRIARPSQEEFASRFDRRDFIALNIRTGNDFVSRSSGRQGYHRTEIDWFVEALSRVRDRYGQMPAVVVSDGGPRQLHQLLGLPDVRLVQAPTAIGDLLVLAKAKVLLGSGNSTFSAWASFLGKMDTYSSPDTPFDHFGIAETGAGQQAVSTI